MPRVRQLPEIYLRGALANETMKHLDPEQLGEVERIVDTVSSHPILSGHRHMFVTQLGNTIGCDYADDRACAMQDYHVAIWRATVHLLYHSPYTYQCSACESSTYTSTQGKPIAINRRFPACPNCKQVVIQCTGDTEYYEGQVISVDQFQGCVDECRTQGSPLPTSKSPIVATAEAQKVEDPSCVLEDPEQLKRFYGQFIWNYFRQIIRENSITTHGKQSNKRIGPADALLTMAIASILRDYNVEHSFEPNEPPSDGYYHIYCNPNATPLDVTEKIDRLLAEADCFSTIDIQFDSGGIRVQDLKAAAPLVELEISRNDPVFIIWTAATDDSGEPVQMVDQIAESDMYEEQPNYDDSDRMSTMRQTLPGGDCQKVFDLLSGEGPLYYQFLERFPASSDKMGIPRLNKIAEFLGCSLKDVKRHQQSIKLTLLAV